jgi:hypothetical protein
VVVVDTGGEKQVGRGPTVVAVAECDRPQIGQFDRGAVGVGKLPQEGAASRVVGGDAAVAVVADEQGPAEGAEPRGGQRHPPRRVERATGGEAMHQAAVEGVHVDHAVARAGEVILAGVISSGVSDVEHVADCLNVERREAVRQVRIPKGAGAHDGLEALVKHVDPALGKIGRIEIAVPGGVHGEGEALVVGADGRVIDGRDGVG